MSSGNKCSLKVDQKGNYHYFDKSGKEISEAEFQKQTGKTGKATVAQYTRNKMLNQFAAHLPKPQIAPEK